MWAVDQKPDYNLERPKLVPNTLDMYIHLSSLVLLCTGHLITTHGLSHSPTAPAFITYRHTVIIYTLLLSVLF